MEWGTSRLPSRWIALKYPVLPPRASVAVRRLWLASRLREAASRPGAVIIVSASDLVSCVDAALLGPSGPLGPRGALLLGPQGSGVPVKALALAAEMCRARPAIILIALSTDDFFRPFPAAAMAPFWLTPSNWEFWPRDLGTVEGRAALAGGALGWLLDLYRYRLVAAQLLGQLPPEPEDSGAPFRYQLEDGPHTSRMQEALRTLLARLRAADAKIILLQMPRFTDSGQADLDRRQKALGDLLRRAAFEAGASFIGPERIPLHRADMQDSRHARPQSRRRFTKEFLLPLLRSEMEKSARRRP